MFRADVLHKTIEVARWALFPWSENQRGHLGLFRIQGLCTSFVTETFFFFFGKIELWLCFFLPGKEYILLKEKMVEKKTFPFSITPSSFTFSILPTEEKRRGGGARMLFNSIAPPPGLILSLMSWPPLLCMKHRSGLKAFSGHSGTEEKRSSELY